MKIVLCPKSCMEPIGEHLPGSSCRLSGQFLQRCDVSMGPLGGAAESISSLRTHIRDSIPSFDFKALFQMLRLILLEAETLTVHHGISYLVCVCYCSDAAECCTMWRWSNCFRSCFRKSVYFRKTCLWHHVFILFHVSIIFGLKFDKCDTYKNDDWFFGEHFWIKAKVWLQSWGCNSGGRRLDVAILMFTVRG